jgi:hypothetical protein
MAKVLAWKPRPVREEPVPCDEIIQGQRDEIALLYKQVRILRRVCAHQVEIIALMKEQRGQHA